MPDPTILQPADAILKVTLCAICGSDLHLYDGYVPTVEDGDILGHEFMGEIVEVGSKVKKVKVGDRVVVPFNIGCGQCWFCQNGLWSLCDNSNPNKELAAKVFGYSPSGLFGYSHIFGGIPGGQAEFVRVPYADVGTFKMPERLSDEQVLFLGDIFSTGYMAAENANIQKGDTVAVWGAGPVGQFTVKAALMMGAGKVIAIDRFAERLELARASGAEVINYEIDNDVVGQLKEKTGGRGPDSVVDAVGMEAHGIVTGLYDKIKQSVMLESDRPTALREAIQGCRKGGTVSIPGVYAGLVDKIPMGAAFNKGLTFKMGQTHTHRYVEPLLQMIVEGKIDPTFVITHRLNLDEAPAGYKMFRDKEDGCIKVVLRP